MSNVLKDLKEVYKQNTEQVSQKAKEYYETEILAKVKQHASEGHERIRLNVEKTMLRHVSEMLYKDGLSFRTESSSRNSTIAVMEIYGWAEKETREPEEFERLFNRLVDEVFSEPKVRRWSIWDQFR